MAKFIAIYVRVSSKRQDTKSQMPDLQRWANAQELPVKFYEDKASGKTMDRPAWNRLEADMRSGESGKIESLVVWRLDRLGRTARGLTALFDDLQKRKVNLVSLKEGLDLTTPAGRLMCHILASCAAYENEVRTERIVAGQSAARAKGVRWGGSKAGVRKKVTGTQERAIRQLHAAKEPIARIARATGLSRPTIYSVLRSSVAVA